LTREWGDSTDTRSTPRYRCVRDNNNTDETGCGWRGSVVAVDSHGCRTVRPEECPDCAGEIAVDE